MSIGTLGLPTKIAFAVVRDEERPDGEIAVVRAKVAVTAVEFGEDASRLPRFENQSTDGSVTELLGQFQILLLRDVAELAAVLGIMLVELRARAESGSGGPDYDGGER